MTVDNSSTAPAPHHITCPSCGAGNVARCRMIFEQGTSSVTTTTTGVGGVVGGGGLAPGVFASSSSGKQQTAFAKKCAPPEGAPVGSFVWCAVIAFAIGLAATGSNTVRYWCWGFAALAFFMALGARHDNKTKLPALMDDYERKWACLTCGHLWERERTAPSSPAHK
jgi:transcription elongation factor Elf1